jgi:hypothetical protein
MSLIMYIQQTWQKRHLGSTKKRDICFGKKQGNSSELLIMTNVYCSASYLLYEEGREMIIRPHRRLSYYYSLSPNSGIICLEAHPCLPAEKSKMSLAYGRRSDIHVRLC